MPSLNARTQLMKHAKDKEVSLTFHYVPLHHSPGGEKFGRYVDNFSNTQHISDVLVRLPLFSDLNQSDVSRVLEVLLEFGR